MRDVDDQRALRKAWRASGRCTSCGRTPRPGRLRCALCAAQQNAANRRRAKICPDLGCGRCSECRRHSRPHVEVA